MRLHNILLACVCLVVGTQAKADTIDYFTLATSAYGSTNLTAFTFDEDDVSDASGDFTVTIDSDPSKTGTLFYRDNFFVLRIFSGQNRILSYFGVSTSLGSSARIGDDDSVEYLMDTFTPGSYTLSSPAVYLSAGSQLSLDSATVTITQDIPAIPPRFPVAPPPIMPSNPATPTPGATAVTPEPSSLLLLGTGMLGFAGVVRRRLRGGA